MNKPLGTSETTASSDIPQGYQQGQIDSKSILHPSRKAPRLTTRPVDRRYTSQTTRPERVSARRVALSAFGPVSVLHVSAKGTLTMCGLAVAFAGDWLTFAEVIRDFARACAEFKRRGCAECRDRLREALSSASQIR